MHVHNLRATRFIVRQMLCFEYELLHLSDLVVLAVGSSYYLHDQIPTSSIILSAHSAALCMDSSALAPKPVHASGGMVSNLTDVR